MPNLRSASLGISAVTVAIGLSLTSTVTSAAPDDSSHHVHTTAGTRQRCMPQTYHERVRVATYHHRARITHRSAFWLASGGHTSHETTAFEALVRAAARLDIGIDLKARQVFREVERHFDRAVRKRGQHTAGGVLSLTDVVRNPTPRRQQFIVFDGVTRYAGTYYLKTCGWDGLVHRLPGHYVTFSDYTVGEARCGAGDAGSRMVHVALRRCS
jgi:hypothetical protein